MIKINPAKLFRNTNAKIYPSYEKITVFKNKNSRDKIAK